MAQVAAVQGYPAALGHFATWSSNWSTDYSPSALARDGGPADASATLPRPGPTNAIPQWSLPMEAPTSNCYSSLKDEDNLPSPTGPAVWVVLLSELSSAARKKPPARYTDQHSDQRTQGQQPRRKGR
jgi:hypothetical protein